MPSPSAHTVRGGQGYVTHKNPGMETQARLFCAVVVSVYEKEGIQMGAREYFHLL